ncbi:MAG: helix-turn-helix domain-containing protein [Candidatus Aenigmarchaeota archaeon]|nr:helix-turn-helix domain-containing protein [Candidatus Aenigmarchaeota archaeon]
MNDQQKRELREFIEKLDSIRGRHTELVTVYVPAGNELTKTVVQLRNEQSTSENIKSKTVRKNVTGAIERILQQLKLYKSTPPNGMAIFAGNISDKEGVADIQVFAIEPPEPVRTKLYHCGQTFILDPLKENVAEKEIYGLLVFDKQEANIGLIKGKAVENIKRLESIVPGKTSKGGQCLAPDTIVQLSDGLLKEIKNTHNPLKIKSMDTRNFSLCDSDITGKWKTKKQKIYRIVTKNPRLQIESSADHVFFTAGKEDIEQKSAAELKKGAYLIMPEKIPVQGKQIRLDSAQYSDFVAVSKSGLKILFRARKSKGLFQRSLAENLNITQTAISLIELGKRNVSPKLLKKICSELELDFGSFLREHTTPCQKLKFPKRLDKTFAQFVGYLIGDGTVERNRISFFEQNRSVAMAYKKRFENYFGMKIHYKYRESKNYHELRFCSKHLVKLVQAEFPEAKAKSGIPEKVLRADDRAAAAFLRGLFDAEGCASKNQKVGLGMNNRHLISQLQLLLLRFGIISSFLEYDNRRNIYSKKHRFTVEISDKRSLQLFDRLISFTSPDKARMLRKIIKNKSKTSYNRQIIVPGSVIRRKIENAGYNLQLFPKVSNFFRDERMMSKQVFIDSVLANIKDKALYSELKKTHDIPFLPVKISRIDIINSPSEMIDISVKSKSFIANGVLVHNSAARFERVREGMIMDFMKEIAELATKTFRGMPHIKGIIIAGPGPTKDDFVKEEYLPTDIRSKVIGIVSTSYTGDYGLKEAFERSEGIIAEAGIMKEKKILERFFEGLAKSDGLSIYGVKPVVEAIKSGNLDLLLISEKFDFVQVTLRCECGNEIEKMIIKKKEKIICQKCGKEMKIIESREIMSEIIRAAEQISSKVEIISAGTPKGEQFLELAGIGGILRYRA